MKLRFTHVSALLLAALMLSFGAKAADEGIDYRTLSQAVPTETGNKIEVLELFWYGCPHCYYLEPSLKKWLARKADYIEFRRLPAVLGRGWLNHGRAYFAAEMLGVLDELHEPFFKALHEKRKRLVDEASIADWFASQGVDKEEFLKAYRSFIVDMKVRRTNQLGQRLGIDGVPSFVVNGKYVTSPSQTGGSEKMFEVLDYLAAKEAGVLPKEEEPVAAVESAAEPAATADAAQADTEEAAETAEGREATTADVDQAPEVSETPADE